VDWGSVFEEARPDPGAFDAELASFAATIELLMSAAEVEEMNR